MICIGRVHHMPQHRELFDDQINAYILFKPADIYIARMCVIVCAPSTTATALFRCVSSRNIIKLAVHYIYTYSIIWYTERLHRRATQTTHVTQTQLTHMDQIATYICTIHSIHNSTYEHNTNRIHIIHNTTTCRDLVLFPTVIVHKKR